MINMKLDILAFGVHPDDVELGCGGTIMASIAEGKRVGIVDLTRGEFKYGKSQAAMLESIANGRPGGMPGFGKELGHEQLEGIVTYLLSLK